MARCAATSREALPLVAITMLEKTLEFVEDATADCQPVTP